MRPSGRPCPVALLRPSEGPREKRAGVEPLTWQFEIVTFSVARATRSAYELFRTIASSFGEFTAVLRDAHMAAGVDVDAGQRVGVDVRSSIERLSTPVARTASDRRSGWRSPQSHVAARASGRWPCYPVVHALTGSRFRIPARSAARTHAEWTVTCRPRPARAAASARETGPVDAPRPENLHVLEADPQIRLFCSGVTKSW